MQSANTRDYSRWQLSVLPALAALPIVAGLPPLVVASNRCHYHRCERTSECRPLVLALDNDDDHDHYNDNNVDDKESSIFHAITITVKGLESADSL